VRLTWLLSGRHALAGSLGSPSSAEFAAAGAQHGGGLATGWRRCDSSGRTSNVDRFHLSANAGAATDEVLRSRRRHVEYVIVAEPSTNEGPTPTAPVPPPSQTQRELAVRRSLRRARWDEVRARRASGYSIQRIARELGMHRRNVRRYLATPEVPRNQPTELPRPKGLSSPTLQPFVAYLQGAGPKVWERRVEIGLNFFPLAGFLELSFRI
jgi:helix-turn-helix resolvase-like protein